MPRLWRLYDHTQPWARAAGFNPLDGSGGLFATGRWNQLGTRMVYAAASASLVALEVLVHVPASLFGERTLVQIEVPDVTPEQVSSQTLLALLRDARDQDREEGTRRYGSTWAAEGRSLLLQVPSMVIPHESNVLINPVHPDAPAVRVIMAERFRLDRRLTQP